jgi:CBS domain-containing protein
MFLHTSKNTIQPGARLSGAAIAPVIDLLRRYAPFDRMETAHLEFLARRLKLGFYAKDEAITAQADGPARRHQAAGATVPSERSKSMASSRLSRASSG